jgi:hypothetical protein
MLNCIKSVLACLKLSIALKTIAANHELQMSSIEEKKKVLQPRAAVFSWREKITSKMMDATSGAHTPQCQNFASCSIVPFWRQLSSD